MLESHFSAQAAEPRLYVAWEQSGAFKPKADPDAETFSIVIPPPNVTGSLHIGHALNCTLQDILCRFERLRGKSVLWQPGLDHAGIATQMVVERQMAQGGTNENRRTLGRGKFLERVWSWKAESGGTITTQLKRLGASCDWSRERFTLDEGLSAAVRKVFVQLHKEGLIYRDKRLVNWDPHFETAVSDLEVVNEERAGHFWHFKYPLENGETYQFPIAFDEDGEPTEFETRDYISIATTRPETMLGDGAVAVHPSDKRYASIVGKRCLLPLADRLIPIIADEYPDPDFGSGAVKITGAHDFNDYKVARRHNIEMFILLDTKGRMLDADYIPEAYRGLDRFDARKQVVADIDARGLMLKVEDKLITQPLGERSDVVIEPMLTDQWYVDAAKLAANALKAVESGETKFVPESWTATYYQWMRNIEPWCVSRQLWWGHRIPAWYDEEGQIFVEETEAEAHAAAKAKHGRDVTLIQDEDVLDTWFSSGLWPFSTLGWPEDTAEMSRFYPTSTLVTMFDIIFFWVARMMMFGCHFTGKAPFSTVVIHSRVVDENGKKMSKSKGNIIDPTVLIDTYGADALRFTLAIAAGPGRDIRMSDKRVEGYRNFGTKLWNAARFAQMNECSLWEAFEPSAVKHTLNRWIVSELTKTAHGVESALSAHRFDEAAQISYAFVWGVFCDLYLELVKPLLNGEDEEAKSETRRTVAWVLDQILKILHPFMPFVTEELWDKTAEFGPKRTGLLINEAWPKLDVSLIDEAAAAEVGWVVDLVTGLRSLRSESNVPAGAKVPALLIGASKETALRLERYQAEIDRLARLDYSVVADAAPAGSVTFVLGEAIVAIPLAGVMDIGAEKARLSKEIARCTKEIETVSRKLDNPGFVAKAPAEVIEEQRERRAAYEAEKQKYEAALTRLG
ncbi:valine--tRNA ligase [Aquidulcibacter sp.]|jgi:valyl-tRNA synthetase|uniref:valine--tRNA ligase n=1 Tax=Aquidulcibacter sp. TaxID=2052990 RepID=UPI0028B257C2|nr:valine--tRNA ligase [Aquidulcibacter sp.]